jgi:hypothetical protein
MEPWIRQFIRALFPYSASRMDIERAFMVKHPHVQAKLYKYREFSSRHLDALARIALWMSSPNEFNDLYDAAVCFNPDRFLIEDQSAKEFIKSVREIEGTIKRREGLGSRRKLYILFAPMNGGEKSSTKC